MDIAPARSFPRRLVPARARVVLAVLAVVVLSVAGTVAGVTATAAAAPQSRSAEPFMAGTNIGVCTAGLVLKDNSALGGITEYRRSVRFILTAGHCGEVGETFTTPDGHLVGNVTWKSATHDFLLIRVEPRLDRGVAVGCEPGSQTLPCVTISSHYYPRAVGRLFTGGPGISENVPVPGTTMSGVSICFSGARSGRTCGHTSFQPPPDPANPNPPGEQDRSYTRGPMSTGGDSGSPMVSSDDNVFGILIGGWGEVQADGSRDWLGVMYTPVSRFFAQQSGYALAPPE